MASDWATFGGSAIGAVGDLLGGIIGSNASAASRNEANRISQNQFHEQMQWQKELAMSGISMRVNDAKAAGIHPLYALGAAPTTFAPVGIGGASDNSGDIWQRSLSGMGQNIGRAIQATATKQERALSLLETERMHLINEGLRLDNRAKQSQLGPPLPVPGTGVSAAGMVGPSPGTGPIPGVGTYEAKPPEIQNSQPGSPNITAGPGAPYVQFADVGNGLRPMPAPGMKTEDEFGAPLMAQWLTDVYLNPGHYRPSQAQVEAKWGKGAVAHWDAHRMQWVQSTWANTFGTMPKNSYSRGWDPRGDTWSQKGNPPRLRYGGPR